MYLVAIAWLYVALMMAVAEAISPQGTVFGGLITLVLYGVAPTALVMYLLGTPGRKARLKQQQLQEQQQALAQRDEGSHAPGSEPVAPEAEKP